MAESHILHKLYPQEDGPVSSHRFKLLIAFVVLVAALGYFAFQSFQGRDGVLLYRRRNEGHRLHAGGPHGPSERQAGAGLLPSRRGFHSWPSSILQTAAENLAAAHNGVLPDLFFNEHSEIILEGRYHPDGVFVSQNVIVKCPSKYVAMEEETG